VHPVTMRLPGEMGSELATESQVKRALRRLCGRRWWDGALRGEAASQLAQVPEPASARDGWAATMMVMATRRTARVEMTAAARQG